MKNVAKLSDLNGVFATFISGVLGLVGIAVLVMFVVAGFQFLSASGDKEAAAKARNTLTFAIIGLILAISAWMIINIVGSFLGFTGFGTFNICFTGGC